MPTQAAGVSRHLADMGLEAARSACLWSAQRAPGPLRGAASDAWKAVHFQECFALAVATAAHGNALSVLADFIGGASEGFAATPAIGAGRAQIDLAAIAGLLVAIG